MPVAMAMAMASIDSDVDVLSLEDVVQREERGLLDTTRHDTPVKIKTQMHTYSIPAIQTISLGQDTQVQTVVGPRRGRHVNVSIYVDDRSHINTIPRVKMKTKMNMKSGGRDGGGG